MTSFAIAALCVLWALWVLLPGSAGPRRNLMLASTGDDADMKIAPESFSPGWRAETDADSEAEDFLRQKSAGNIQLARELGSRYADLLMAQVRKNFDPWPTDLAGELHAHHRLLLLAYTVNRVVSELSPSPVLAQTTRNVFYQSLEEKAPQLDKYIRDMASYSLYMLHERSQSGDEDEIGRIFARLCADKDNPDLIDRGNRYYREYYTLCKELFSRTQYKPV